MSTEPEQARRRPSQRDIARMTNVSQATVSMVLNGRSQENSIPVATQERIFRAVSELGYTPNIAARSLRGGRNGLIGVHTFARVFPVGEDDYYHDFLVGIEERAIELAQDLVLFASTRSADGTRSIYRSGFNRLRLADGAVMLGIEQDDDELARLSVEGFPFVFIGHRVIAGCSIPYVAPDYTGAVARTIKILLQHRHTSIGYLGTPARPVPQQERLAAFEQQIQSAGLAVSRPTLMEPDGLSEQWLETQLRGGVTALVVETHQLARALLTVAEQSSVDVPGELSVVCLDVGPRSAGQSRWSHIGFPRRELGRRAVSVLLGILDGTLAGDHREVLACTEPGTQTLTWAPGTRSASPVVSTGPEPLATTHS